MHIRPFAPEEATEDDDVRNGDVAAIERRLRSEGHVHTAVFDGLLHIDRMLPFLCVHRRPDGDDTGADRLVTGQASYLTVSGDARFEDGVRELVTAVAEAAEEVGGFGSFLLVELWTVPGREPFTVVAPPEGCSPVGALVGALEHVDVLGTFATVETASDASVAPPGRPPLLTAEQRRAMGVVALGLGVPAFFVDENGQSLPLVFRRLQFELSRALRSAAFEFATVETTYRPADLRELGPQKLDEKTLDVDRRLAEIASRLDYLLVVTPVDPDLAWRTFQANGYGVEPSLHYRALPVDPDLLKRDLFAIPIEDVEEPTLAAMFREKRYELDAHIDLLVQRDSPAFLNTSLTLFGTAEPDLLVLAESILERAAVHRAAMRSRPRASSPGVDAETFADRVRSEIAWYASMDHGVAIPIEERDDITGVMVSNGRVLIDSRLQLPRERVDALIQHEVGTHVVTFVNGTRQQLCLLRVGLPGYEEAQEALAVVAEHVVGGLTLPRMATLAARVLVTHCLTEGASFVEAFETLRSREVMSPAGMFDVVMRIYRGGGLTKDVIYLRGLQKLLRYLGDGRPLDPLLVGKLSLEYVPIVEELCWRRVVTPPVIEPKWLTWPGADDRLERVRQGINVTDLLPEVP